MVNPSHRQERLSVLPLLLVGAISALVVAGIYEVRARLAKHHPELQSDTKALQQFPQLAQAEDPPVPAGERCTDLRRRYLARCPNDLLTARPGKRQVSAVPTGSHVNESRAGADLASWQDPSPAELGEMAKRCEVRLEMPAITENQPRTVTDEESAALSLSSRERELLQETLIDMHAGLQHFAKRAIAGTADLSDKVPEPTFEEILADLRARPENGFDEARQKVAQERAGLSPPPESDSNQPPGERLLRVWTRMGDEFERRLAAGLGSERAHQLRLSPNAGWINRSSQSGCRSQPQIAAQ